MKTTIKTIRNVKIELSEEQVRDAIMSYVIDNYGAPLTNRDIEDLEPQDIGIFWDQGCEGGFGGQGYRPEGIRVQIETSSEQ